MNRVTPFNGSTLVAVIMANTITSWTCAMNAAKINALITPKKITMPKISNKAIRVKHDDLDESVNFTIYYNQESSFWAEIPANLNEKFDQLQKDDLVKLSAERAYKYKHQHNGPYKRIVTSESEAGVVNAMTALVNQLLTLLIEKEPVIIVRFENNNQFERHHDPNPDQRELKKVGLALSATYCFKVSTGGTQAKYYKYDERDWFGEMKTTRTEVHIHSRNEAIVIPDTPGNRQFIEDLHAALGALVKKLEEFTATSEDMLALISKQQKLLSL